jgi:hypothetical protein
VEKLVENFDKSSFIPSPRETLNQSVDSRSTVEKTSGCLTRSWRKKSRMNPKKNFRLFDKICDGLTMNRLDDELARR